MKAISLWRLHYVNVVNFLIINLYTFKTYKIIKKKNV